jgi:hypothetical protein
MSRDSRRFMFTLGAGFVIGFLIIVLALAAYG